MCSSDLNIVDADLSLPAHAAAVVQLMDTYACDPMGGGKGLPEDVKARLPAELARRDSAHIILAFAGVRPAGLVNTFEGFSTFASRPLLNVHDVIVAPEYRRRGLAKRMLARAEEIARSLGCCKLTLEVLEGNDAARAAYRMAGFTGYELDPTMGRALFWEKKLS